MAEIWGAVSASWNWLVGLAPFVLDVACKVTNAVTDKISLP